MVLNPPNSGEQRFVQGTKNKAVSRRLAVHTCLAMDWEHRATDQHQNQTKEPAIHGTVRLRGPSLGDIPLGSLQQRSLDCPKRTRLENERERQRRGKGNRALNHIQLREPFKM